MSDLKDVCSADLDAESQELFAFESKTQRQEEKHNTLGLSCHRDLKTAQQSLETNWLKHQKCGDKKISKESYCNV